MLSRIPDDTEGRCFAAQDECGAIDRVRQMEGYFDALQEAASTDPDALREDDAFRAMLRHLMQYYEGGQWLQDYELDEKGSLPQDLKRGVLSQDAVYNFLAWIEYLNSDSEKLENG